MCSNILQKIIGAKPPAVVKAPTPAAAVSGATGAEQKGTLVGEGAQSSSSDYTSGVNPKKARKATVVGLDI